MNDPPNSIVFPENRRIDTAREWMDLLGAATLAVSLLALAVSVATALRQIRIMHHTNQLPVLVELFQEFRSSEFQLAERYVVQRLRDEQDPETGCMLLPEEAFLAVTKVVGFYSGCGAFMARKMADEGLVVPLLGYRASRAWDALEPFIRREREIRESSDRYASVFEDFVWRVRRHTSLEKAYGLRLRTLPPTPAREVPPPEPQTT
ncbi:DUF4760 domain-containing protein [Microbispora triticiradicis]|uniref:DUF4760 domain-containing protein n=2 Tax=Microbispora TaxID=2005 RepID=UPI001AD6FC16|nr:hypothetical protein [Microbispora triticiradicis]MBO4270882.1 hypothetical protein [Microbispora triticiradicis]